MSDDDVFSAVVNQAIAMHHQAFLRNEPGRLAITLVPDEFAAMTRAAERIYGYSPAVTADSWGQIAGVEIRRAP